MKSAVKRGKKLRWDSIVESSAELVAGMFVAHSHPLLDEGRNKAKFDSLRELPASLLAAGLAPHPVDGGYRLLPAEDVFVSLPPCDEELVLEPPAGDIFSSHQACLELFGHAEDAWLSVLEEAGLWQALLGVNMFAHQPGQMRGPHVGYKLGSFLVEDPVSFLRPDLVRLSSRTVLVGEVKRSPAHDGSQVSVRQLVLPALHVAEVLPQHGFRLPVRPVFVHFSSQQDACVWVFQPVRPGMDAASVVVERAVSVTVS